MALVTGGANALAGRSSKDSRTRGSTSRSHFLAVMARPRTLLPQLREKGRICLPIRADLTDPANALRTIYEPLISQFGRLDVLVNNASLYLPTDPEHVELDNARKMWAIHVESPLLLCQQFASLLRASKGHVVNMVDLLAERPWPRFLAYSASQSRALESDIRSCPRTRSRGNRERHRTGRGRMAE